MSAEIYMCMPRVRQQLPSRLNVFQNVTECVEVSVHLWRGPPPRSFFLTSLAAIMGET